MTVDAAPRPAVHVALPGALIEAGDRAGPRESHVGGVPVLPGAPSGTALPPACGSCGDDMVLVLQVREEGERERAWEGLGPRRAGRQPVPPLSQAHTPLPALVDRCLLVYACAGDECGKEAGAWAAVRVQRRQGGGESRRPPSPPPAPLLTPADEADAPLAPSDDWGLGAGAGWGVVAAAPAQARAPSAPRGPPAATDASSSSSWWSPPPSFAARTPFRVVWAAEPPPLRPPGPADSHVAALLSAYVDDGDAGEAVVEAVDCEGQGAAAAPTATPPPPSAVVGWAGETYEPDAAPGADAAYLAFAKRLAWAPTQLARHGVGAAPLWPKKEAPPSPPPCASCGARRAWELTLVSPLAALMDEAAAWAGANGAGAPRAWEWAALAVAACAESCGVGDEGDVVTCAEHVALANE